MTERTAGATDYQAVKALPIETVLAKLDLIATLRRSGNNLTGACPVHGGTNKRQFTVSPQKNLWFCHGDCRRGGTAIDLVAALFGVAEREAAQQIAEWFAIPPVRSRRSQHARERRTKVSGTPSHKVFAVEDKGDTGTGDTSWWTRCGSAWPHKDGRGLNIQLSALPVNGRLVLREFDPEDAKIEEAQRAKRSKK